MAKQKTHQQIMQESSNARKHCKSESAIWAEGTRFTAEALESLYEDYVVVELESGNNDYKSAPEFWEKDLGIENL